jgi:alpha-tubulin suppressor-like RCC1 family protein
MQKAVEESENELFRVQRWQMKTQIAVVACGKGYTLAALRGTGIAAWGTNVMGECGVAHEAISQVHSLSPS